MKTEVWRVEDRARGVKAVRAWHGDIAIMPRAGDHVCLHDGWCIREVKRVSFNLYDQTAEIEIGPDYTGEYAAEIEAGEKK